jgi:hypothetical protein
MTIEMELTAGAAGGAQGVIKKAVTSEDQSHPWSGVGGDEFFTTVDYETPRGGEWYIPHDEPFDLAPGVEDLHVLDILDAAIDRVIERIDSSTVEGRRSPLFQTPLTEQQQVDRVKRAAANLLSAAGVCGDEIDP